MELEEIKEIVEGYYYYFLDIEHFGFIIDSNTFAPILRLKFKEIDKIFNIEYVYVHTKQEFISSLTKEVDIHLINVIRYRKLKKIKDNMCVM